jgi:hypothetical protein
MSYIKSLAFFRFLLNLAKLAELAHHFVTTTYAALKHFLTRSCLYIVVYLWAFESSIVFRVSWGSSVNWLKPKIIPPYKISLPESVKRSVVNFINILRVLFV